MDIQPHRKLIKQGIELPEAMRAKPEFHNMVRMDLDEAFKEEEHPFRIAIVCAMWLTGFDVPSLSTLYLDKPLKAHTLMQAIARANRVNEGKNNGLVVDYCGILKHLRKALATFTGTPEEDDGNDPTKPNEELLEELTEAIGLARVFLEDKGASLDDVIHLTGFPRNAAIVACKEAVNENDESRKWFEVMCREIFKKFKACINIENINDYRGEKDAINVIYKSLQADRDRADITDIMRQLQQVVDEAIDIDPDRDSEEAEPYDISKIDFDLLRKEFERSKKKNTTVQNLRQVVEKRLQKLLAQNPLRTNFQIHYETIVAEYNREKDRVTIEKTFEDLMKLVQELTDEESRAAREGLDEESLAIFDLLKKEELNASDIKKIKDVAVDLLHTLKEKITGIDHWQEKETTRDAVQVAIRHYLWNEDTGLPVDLYKEDEVESKAGDVFFHIYQKYPTVPSPYYEAKAS